MVYTAILMFYNTEWRYDHGMAVNYHSKKFYNIGPRRILLLCHPARTRGWLRPLRKRQRQKRPRWSCQSRKTSKLWINLTQMPVWFWLSWRLLLLPGNPRLGWAVCGLWWRCQTGSTTGRTNRRKAREEDWRELSKVPIWFWLHGRLLLLPRNSRTRWRVCGLRKEARGKSILQVRFRLWGWVLLWLVLPKCGWMQTMRGRQKRPRWSSQSRKTSKLWINLTQMPVRCWLSRRLLLLPRNSRTWRWVCGLRKEARGKSILQVRFRLWGWVLLWLVLPECGWMQTVRKRQETAGWGTKIFRFEWRLLQSLWVSGRWVLFPGKPGVSYIKTVFFVIVDNLPT